MRHVLIFLLLTMAVRCAQAQWAIEESGTTADLRGIDVVGGGVAWASGTHGTVLRTVDDGAHWQRCSTPDGADGLDFRGVQAFDAETAIVMSSGSGDLSRLYKTADGCRTWKLVFTNPDKDGFWDALLLHRYGKDGALLGDPVHGRFSLWETQDKGETWTRSLAAGLEAHNGEGAFAASNSSLFLDEAFATGFVTGGNAGARLFFRKNLNFIARVLPLKSGSESTGGFSFDARSRCCWVAVGGDYQKPNETNGTAAYTRDGGKSWLAAQTMPHGYRSSVAYDEAAKMWIAVGPNGTDVSADDGKNWRALRPDAAHGDAADADRNWNALSLPFVVGPKGRIGKLRAEAPAAGKESAQ